MAPTRHENDWTRQIGEATAFGYSDRHVQGPTDCNGWCPVWNANHSTLNHIGNSTISECPLGLTGACFNKPLAVDAVENSTSLGKTSSCSLKNFGQLQFAYSSKSALRASPMDESAAMRKWKEIKQNGFLTHPHGGVPIPEPQHGKKSKRKTKGNDVKRKLETTEVEQVNRGQEMAKKEQDIKKVEITKHVQRKRRLKTAKREHENTLKTAPCSELLSRISTGIIRRVKNYEEVHAILEDMVRVEQSDSQIQTEFVGQEESRGKKFFYEENYQNQLFQSLNRLSDHKSKATISEDFDERSYPEVAATASCISDYYKKLYWILTSYSNIISRKCENILSVEHDLNIPAITSNPEHGRISHDTDNLEEIPQDSEHVRISRDCDSLESHDSDNCGETLGHETIIASQFVLDCDKNCP